MNKIQNWEEIIKEKYQKIRISEILNPIEFEFWQQVLLFISIISLSICIYIPLNIKQEFAAPASQATSSMKTLNYNRTTPDWTSILNTLTTKKLFKAYDIRPEPTKLKKKSSKLKDKLNSLDFLGVLDETPKKALIESKTTKETYYVKEGDIIMDMEIISITSEEITISSDGETGVLR